MTEFEYEVERDKIELAYGEKIMELKNLLREIAVRNTDLTMERAKNEREIYKITSNLDMLEFQCDKELHELEREFLSKKTE